MDVKVTVNGNVIFSSNEANGSFYFDPLAYNSGKHTLVLSAITNSGTGSLADVTGGEGVLFERKYTIILDNDPPNQVAFKSVKRQNGSLRIEWEKYNRPNFLSYSINVNVLRDSTVQSGYDYVTYSYEILDPNQTVLLDSAFSGGKCTLFLKVNTVNSRDIDYSSYSQYSFQDELPRIVSFESLSDKRLKITWSRCRYDNSFHSYSFSLEYSSLGYYRTENINDTTAIIDQLEFGVQYPFLFSVQAKDPRYPSSYLSYSTARSIYMGDKALGYFEYPFFTEQRNELYTFYYGKLFRWSNGSPIAENEGQINYEWDNYSWNLNAAVGVSKNLEHIIIGTGENIQALNPADLSVKYQISTHNFLNAGEIKPSSISVSDEGSFFVALSRPYQFRYPWVVVAYDLPSGSITDSLHVYGNLRSLISNRAGNRILVRDYSLKVLKVQNGKFINKESYLEVEDVDAVFNPLNEQEVIGFISKRVNIYDTETLQLKRSYSLPESTKSLSVDQATGNIGCKGTDGYYYVFSSVNGQLVKKEKLFTMYYTYIDAKYFLNNNILYSSFGLTHSFQ
jgi:hypothetical protein